MQTRILQNNNFSGRGFFMMEKKERLSFSEWCENMWYHYKWLIIFGGLMLLFLVVSVIQMNKQKDPDVNTLFVGPWYLSVANIDELETTISGFSRDYNDDGKIKVNTLDLTIQKLKDEGDENVSGDETLINHDERNETLQRFQVEIRTGDAVIYFLDREFFDICVKENILTPIDEIIDDAYMPDTVIDGCGIPLSALDVYRCPGISRMPEDTVLCIRRSPEKDDITYGRTMETWDGNRQTFVNMVKYRNTAQD